MDIRDRGGEVIIRFHKQDFTRASHTVGLLRRLGRNVTDSREGAELTTAAGVVWGAILKYSPTEFLSEEDRPPTPKEQKLRAPQPVGPPTVDDEGDESDRSDESPVSIANELADELL